MCVAVPSKIVAINPQGMATIEVGGARQKVSLLLLEDAGVGDYVLVHAGFAIKKLDPKEAQETLKILKEIIESSPESGFETSGDPSL
jgi:hydrogenase expression/formation protein HypC